MRKNLNSVHYISTRKTDFKEKGLKKVIAALLDNLRCGCDSLPFFSGLDFLCSFT